MASASSTGHISTGRFSHLRSSSSSSASHSPSCCGSKRVLAKHGFIQRESIETLLSKVEAISVDQGIPGRVLGFGTIVLTGTGGTEESFPRIAAPLEFRRQIQSQVVALEERRGPPSPALSGERDATRVERECPYCAERILARARVCKHCGREVTPVT
jgi:hypothetical protein